MKREIEPDTTITSKIMGKEYQLYISFPKNYSIKDTIKYPVLYVLDGKKSYPAFKTARENLDIDKEIQVVIIVGIGSGLDFISNGINRTFDYTPSQDTNWVEQFAKYYKLDYNLVKGKLHSGGAQKFLQCITTEIIPYMDTHYKTTSDRGITGHSLGGLFTAYCFLNTKGVFTRFGINSPSLWWNNNEILNQADSLFTKNDTWDIPFTKVYISIGQKEGPKMVPNMVKFSTMLESKEYKNIQLDWHFFEDKTHGSVADYSLKQTILFLYAKKNNVSYAEVNRIKGILNNIPNNELISILN